MADADAEPRLDEIEGWPLPEAQERWLGDVAAERVLLDAYRSGRMHHAWLIGGPKGVGKATLAYRFARFVLHHPTPASVPDEASDLTIPSTASSFRRIAAGGHSNVIALSRPWDSKSKRFRTALTVDEIRRLIPFFGSTAGEEGWRVAIVDRADDMNRNAANALLKLLEEPPSRALFLVLSDTPGRLLPTIRSRCRRITLMPLPQSAIEQALLSEDAEQADRRLAAELAGGSLRKAILLVQEDGVAIYRDLVGLLARLPRLDLEQAYGLAERVARRENEALYDIVIDLIRDWLWRRVRGLPEPYRPEGTEGVFDAMPLAAWAKVWEKLEKSVALTDELNLDRKQLIMSLLTSLSSAVRM
jgi:DNA polymerase-3 subunit delta'